VSRREVDESVDAAADAYRGAARQVMDEKLRGVAGLGGLLRREEPLLCGRDLVEAVPVGVLRRARGHARNVSHALVLCKLRGARNYSGALVSCRPRDRHAAACSLARLLR